ncbi:MAG: glycosyltransferase family 4 protein [Alphaproteobacteria bacterium]|nr:glycosyltransferase family 4 protein [Alphaproteobacteria bacterium]
MTAARRLRILHTEASLGWGGQEIRILTEARQIAARGHELRLICDGDSDIFRAAPRFGLETTAVPLKRKSIKALGAMRRVFSAWRPDIVNTHSSIDHWLAAVARLGLARRPAMVRTRHISAPVSRNGPTRWLYNRGCELVMTTSRAMVRDLTVDGFLSPDHVVAVPTGIDTDQFRPGDRRAARKRLGLPSDAFVFGTVATLRSWKGHGFLLDAFAKLKDRDTLLLMVGDGPQEANLAEHTARLGLHDRVHMAGRRDDVVPYLRAMDVFVFPSTKNEGVPQALLQAMACGLPVVASRIGGVPEVVEGLGGVAEIAAQDADDLFRAMTRMMADPCDEAARASLRQRVTGRYAIGDMTGRVLTVFEQALAIAEKP